MFPKINMPARMAERYTFWGYHTLLAVRAYHRLDGTVGILIDLTSDDFIQGPC